MNIYIRYCAVIHNVFHVKRNTDITNNMVLENSVEQLRFYIYTVIIPEANEIRANVFHNIMICIIGMYIHIKCQSLNPRKQ